MKYFAPEHECEMHATRSHAWVIDDRAKHETVKGLVWCCSVCGKHWQTITEITDLVSDDAWLDDRFVNSP